METKQNWKEIVRWILTVISAILAGLGAESCAHEDVINRVSNDLIQLVSL